jgi:hypothetical protein
MKATTTDRLRRPIAGALVGGACLCAVFAPIRAARAQDAASQAEAAATSRLTGIPLPGSPRRLTDPSQLARITPQLDELAGKAHRRTVSPELLVWPLTTASDGERIRGQAAQSLKAAGYQYEERSLPGDAGTDTWALVAEGKGKQVAGFWVNGGSYLALAWCRLEAAIDADANSPTAVAPSAGVGAAQAAPAAGTLVDGKMLLTGQMVDQFCRFIEWVVDAPLTGEQRQLLQAYLVDGWKKRDKNTIDTAVGLLKLREQVNQLPAEKRELLRAKVQPELLKNWRQQQKYDPSARWILGIYDAAHKPIAPGNPPLTRQVTDAYAEVVSFMASEVTGNPKATGKEFKDAASKALVASYGRMSAAQQEKLSQFPMLWAALRVAWPTLPEEDRAKLRQQWATSLRSMTPPSAEDRAASAALARLQAFTRKANGGTKITPAEFRSAAGDMDAIASSLRKQGGEANLAQAARLEETARTYRAATASQPLAGGSRPSSARAVSGGNDAYERLMEIERRRHNAYVTLSNASLTSHVATMNMIAIMGDSPYRYYVR